MNLRFKEGQMVKMIGHDDMIVEGAIGVITDVQAETVKVLWVVVSMISHYTQKGKAGFILETDYRTCLPYCVKWDDGSTSWVIGCTVTTETQEDSIIEESEEDIKIDLISENGFSKEVTFYERN